jgi:hypothetical protein
MGRTAYTGKLSARPAGKPGDSLIVRGGVCDNAFLATAFRNCKEQDRAPRMRFLRHGGIYLVRCGLKTLGGPSRLPSVGPGPGSRTCREDHAPSHRPRMSSGRLSLDRVARQESPSLLHRRPQNNTHFSEPRAKGDISTLLARVTFLLCVDTRGYSIVLTIRPCSNSNPTEKEGMPYWSPQAMQSCIKVPGPGCGN